MRNRAIVNVERQGLAKSTKYFEQAFLNNISVFVTLSPRSAGINDSIQYFLINKSLQKLFATLNYTHASIS